MASNYAKVPGTPKPKSGPRPDAPIQMGPAELDAIHRKAIQSIDAAGKAMSVARANVEMTKSSKEDRKKVHEIESEVQLSMMLSTNVVVAKATEVVGPLLAPSRHVVKLLSGLGALFPPCKQVSSTLAPVIKYEVNRHKKDVRVAIIHFDLARALVHIGSLNRKSRPGKSIGDPLSKLLKNFKGVIQEFSQFCEAYYETKARDSALKHLRQNKDSLNSFADRITQLKKSLTSLLSQQAVQHPGNHMDVLVQIESRLAKNRAFYATIRDTNEEITEAPLSKQLKRGGEASVRLGRRPLKQSAGTVGEGVTHRISSAKKKTTASTLPDAKATRRGVMTTHAPVRGQRTGQVDTKSGPPRPPQRVHKQVPMTTHAPARGQRTGRVDTKSGPPRPSQRIHKQAPMSTHAPARGQRTGRADTKSGPPRPPQRIHKQAPMTTHAPACGPRTGQQQKKGTSEPRGKLQTSLVQGHTVNTTESRSKRYRDVAGDQELRYLQEDGEIADGLGVDGEDEDEDEDEGSYPSEDDSEEGGADSADPEQEDEYEDSEEGAADSADPELEDEYEDSEEGGDNSADPEQEDEYEDSEEGAADSADPELEDEDEDSEEGAADSADPELEDEYEDSEEGAADSADPEQEDEYEDSEEGAADSADPEQEDEYEDSEEGAADSADPEQEDEFEDSEEGDPEQEDEPEDSEEGADSADPEQEDEPEDSEEGGADFEDPEQEDEYNYSEPGGGDESD